MNNLNLKSSTPGFKMQDHDDDDGFDLPSRMVVQDDVMVDDAVVDEKYFPYSFLQTPSIYKSNTAKRGRSTGVTMASPPPRMVRTDFFATPHRSNNMNGFNLLVPNTSELRSMQERTEQSMNIQKEQSTPMKPLWGEAAREESLSQYPADFQRSSQGLNSSMQTLNLIDGGGGIVDSRANSAVKKPKEKEETSSEHFDDTKVIVTEEVDKRAPFNVSADVYNAYAEQVSAQLAAQESQERAFIEEEEVIEQDETILETPTAVITTTNNHHHHNVDQFSELDQLNEQNRAELLDRPEEKVSLDGYANTDDVDLFFKELQSPRLSTAERARGASYVLEQQLASRKAAVLERTMPLLTLSGRDSSIAADMIQNTPRQQVVFDSSMAEVTGECLRGLLPNTWLGDSVINAYLSLVLQHSRAHNRRVHVFSSFFLTKLMAGPAGYDYGSVRRWSKTQKVNLLNLDLLLVPCHVNGNHWSLCYADFRHKQILYIDSLLLDKPDILRAVKQYIQDDIREHQQQTFSMDDWTLSCPKTIPRQRDAFNCGVYVCLNASLVARGVSIHQGGVSSHPRSCMATLAQLYHSLTFKPQPKQNLVYSHEQINAFRHRIALDLKAKRIL